MTSMTHLIRSVLCVCLILVSNIHWFAHSDKPVIHNPAFHKRGSLFTTNSKKDTRFLHAWNDVYDIKRSPEFLSTYDGTNNIANAIKIVLEADKVLFIQFLMHLFASLNALIEGVVAKNLKQSIRIQCIIAIVLIKVIDILCCITSSPTRGLGNVDVNNDMLQDSKQMIQKVIIMNDGYILMYACLAFLCGPNIGSSIPLLISQIPFYTKYFALLTSASSSASIESIINVLSTTLPLFANHALHELKDHFLPSHNNDSNNNSNGNREKIPQPTQKSSSSSSSSLSSSKIKKFKPKFSINDDDQPPPLIDIGTLTAELELTSASASNSTNTNTNTTLDIPKHQQQDILETFCNNAFFIFESIYFLQYIITFIHHVINHTISGFLHLISQFFLSFLVIQYLFNRILNHGIIVAEVIKMAKNVLFPSSSSSSSSSTATSSGWRRRIQNILNQVGERLQSNTASTKNSDSPNTSKSSRSSSSKLKKKKGTIIVKKKKKIEDVIEDNQPSSSSSSLPSSSSSSSSLPSSSSSSSSLPSSSSSSSSLPSSSLIGSRDTPSKATGDVKRKKPSSSSSSPSSSSSTSGSSASKKSKSSPSSSSSSSSIKQSSKASQKKQSMTKKSNNNNNNNSVKIDNDNDSDRSPYTTTATTTSTTTATTRTSNDSGNVNKGTNRNDDCMKKF